MAGLLDYCRLVCAATAGVSGGYPDPQAKTDPPGHDGCWGTYLLVAWQYPPGIALSYFPLPFQLRHRELGSSTWVHEPDVGEQTSYHRYDVRPDTTYVLMVRCKSAEGNGFWSEWSAPASVSLGPASARSESTHPMAMGPAPVPAALPCPGTAGITTENFTEYYIE